MKTRQMSIIFLNFAQEICAGTNNGGKQTVRSLKPQ